MRRTRSSVSEPLAKRLQTIALYTILTWSSAAHAEKTQPAAEADSLFEEAKRLAEAGDYAGACPKLERSLSLDPAIGTEYNLADCYELADAWRHFRNVVDDARRSGKTERAQAATARMSALQPQLAWLRIVPGRHAPPAFRFAVDGQVLGGAIEGKSEQPLQPGPHTLRAIGSDEWVQRVDAKKGVTLVVRPFESAPRTGERTRAAAIALGSVGLAGLVFGSGAGIASVINHDRASERCPDRNGCATQSGVDAWQGATTAGTLSTVGLIAGGLALAAGVTLYLVAPRDRRTTTTAWTLATGGVRF